MFQPMRRLRWLHLGNNRISVVTAPTVRHLQHLDYLQLCNNGITYIYEALLNGMVKLEHLDISGNKLKRLDIRALHLALPILRKVNIMDNAFLCQDLEAIIRDMEVDSIGAVLANNVTKFKDIQPNEIGELKFGL